MMIIQLFTYYELLNPKASYIVRTSKKKRNKIYPIDDYNDDDDINNVNNSNSVYNYNILKRRLSLIHC